jgi:hypothetical protein
VFGFASITTDRVFAQFAVGEVEIDWIESMLFQNKEESAVRKGLLANGDSRIELIDSVCTLDASDKQKLKLAYKNDVRRFFEALTKPREQLRAMDPQNANYEEIQVILAPYQRQLQSDLRGPASMFVKLTNGILDQEQKSKWNAFETAETERRRLQLTRSHVSEISLVLPMTVGTCHQLAELLDAELQRYPEYPLNHQYAAWGIGLIAARVEGKQFNNVLDAGQQRVWQTLHQKQVGMEQFLEQQLGLQLNP